MRTLAFDGRTGASGDMLLGALLAAGADRAALVPVEDDLPIEYDVQRVDRAGIAATAVDVQFDNGSEAEGHGPHRSYGEVVDVVEGLDIPSPVRDRTLAIFERLGEAEAAVHGTELAETHFHEVGADDAIADVVGTCLLLADLEPDRVVTGPLAAGGGEVETAHGTYPVPAPAVVELASGADWTLRHGPIERELLTPTGAAILAEVADGVPGLPSMAIDASGYGAGSMVLDDRPNVLRAVIGEAAAAMAKEPITVLETNLDDASPELLGGLQDTLTDIGALDVSVLPTTMKKSRPGHLVRVVVAPEDAERVARRLAEETGTLGVREHGSGHRWVADRERQIVEIDVNGDTYEVGVKIGLAGDEVFDISAEFDDAMAVARASDQPVRHVMRLAEDAAREP
ncbi:MAG: nickel pincer cofactor biosynthesis protein LarC [Salinirussus sp.]